MRSVLWPIKLDGRRIGIAGIIENVGVGVRAGVPGKIAFSACGGDLASPIDCNVNLDGTSGVTRVTKAATVTTNFVRLTLNSSLGTVAGSFNSTSDARGAKLIRGGLILQGSNAAYGYWLGTNGQSGSIYLH